jgi:MoxR-like ATPase
VLLIDELDRADEEFEAYLLEVLSDFQVTIPEIGTIAAERPPVVVITSNRTREVHDALKRRCIYHWVEYPTEEREVAIIRARVPDVDERLAHQLAVAMQRLRSAELFKPPGVAETLDWARALQVLGADRLDEAAVADTLGVILKYREDVDAVRTDGLDRLVDAPG